MLCLGRLQRAATRAVMRGVRTRGGSNRTLVAPPASSSVWQQHERLQSQGAADEDARPESHPWLSELPAGPSTLLAEERVLTFLSASIGAGNLTNVARDWRQVLCATSAGAQPSYVSHSSRFLPRHMHPAGMEVALQAHLFAGYARAINALATIHRVGVHEEPAAEAAGGPAAAMTDEDFHGWRHEKRSLDAWRGDGEEACALIYGRAYDKLRKRMGDMHPVLDAMMIENGYGRVLSRPGLALRVRELCVLAILAGQDVAPQLNSHIRGALRVGASRAEVVAVLEQTSLAWGPDAQMQAMATLETVDNARYGL